MRKFTAFAMLFFVAARTSYAQQDTSTQLLDEVVITAQRTQQKELLVPYSTKTITRAYTENFQPRTTPEALTGVNGVFIQKTNHGGGSPFIRGLTGNQTLILVDGIRLNNSTFRYGPNQYLNTIDAYTIHRMEVVKGTGSVQYGTDALGGVLQIFTKEPAFSDAKQKWSGRALGKYMTGDMEKTIRGEAGFRSQKFAAHVGATYRNFGDLFGGDTTGKQSPSGYKEFAFDTKLKFLLQPRVVLTLANQFLQQQHVPVYHKVVLENFAVNEFDPQFRMLNYAKLTIGGNSNLLGNIEIIASWQKSIEGRNSRKNGSTTLRKEKDEINTLGLTTDISSRLSGIWTANSGVEIYNDRVGSTREDINIQNNRRALLRGLYPDGSGYTNSSVYSLHHFNLNKWAIEGGLRLNTFSIRISDTTVGKVTINPSAFVYNAAVMYNISNQHHLYATVSSGFRAPNIDDLGTLGIVDFRYEVPTTSLKPEKSMNTEAGYKFKTKEFGGTVAGFYMHLDDLITRLKVEGHLINGYQVYAKENVEKAYIKGFETEVYYDVLKSLTLTGNLSYAYGQSLSKAEPLRRIPPMFGRVNTTWHKQEWFASAELLFAAKQERLAQGDREDNRIPTGGTPGWNILNVYTGYELKHVKLNVGLQNLFDEDYRTHGSGINGVGRSAWIAVAIKL